jgi:RimJ/RimL family protein N-acetyltransferase
MCTSVLEGIYPGSVFVDDPGNPKSALLTTYIEDPNRGIWGFLVGAPNYKSFNHALNASIFNRKIIPPGSPTLLLTCDPGDWGGQMPVVMAPRPPIWMPRWHFTSRQLSFDWQSALPKDFAVEPMGGILLERVDLEVPDDVRTTIEKWLSMEHPKFQDYGIVTLDRNSKKPIIAGWATVDFIAQGAGDLGFFTQPEYRCKGLGTIAAAAALERGFEAGLTQINWTCDANNQGSIHTAKKLGLELIEDYRIALLVMDEAEHFGNFGYHALQAKNSSLAASSFDQALKLAPESPSFIYYEAAQAYAMVGEHQKALEHFKQAVDRGWTNVDHARKCQAFTSLHGFPEWEMLIEKMESSN